jgi:hypothetical protein
MRFVRTCDTTSQGPADKAHELDCQLSLEDGLHPSGRFVLKLRNYMAVRVHGQCDLRVAQNLHDHAGRNALYEQESGTRMPEVVESYAPKPSLLQSFVKLLDHAPCLGGSAVPVCKHQSTFPPPRARPKPFGDLALLMLA